MNKVWKFGGLYIHIANPSLGRVNDAFKTWKVLVLYLMGVGGV